jgi:hypothetical protein
MRSPERPLWRSGRPWTRTLIIVIGVLSISTPAVVYLPSLAGLLHLAPFAAPWWLVVIATAASTAWSEPLKGRSRPAGRAQAVPHGTNGSGTEGVGGGR